VRFDPELAVVLAALPADEPDPADAVGMRKLQARALLDATGGAPATDERVEFDDRLIPGPAGAPDVKVRVYRPRARQVSLGVFVYFHGGGFIAGDIEGVHGRALMFAAEVGCVVVSVNYRLAPEDPFPAGVDDCYAALLWISEGADDLGIDRARIAVGGESSGAALAAAVALMARDRDGPAIAFQLLLYPVIDDRMQTLSMRRATDAPVWNSRSCDVMWQHYLGKARGPAAPDVSSYAAPGRALDVSGLPPTYISTCEGDPLRDEGIEYAQRLLRAAVTVELHQYAGTFHGFDMVGPTTVGKRALQEQVDVLRAALKPRSATTRGGGSNDQ
jgi:acetyl esterase/lipase